MAHVPTPAGYPGIVGLFAFRPETAVALNDLAETVLCDASASLSPGERELIAAFVSNLNGTQYCRLLHGAAASAHLGTTTRVEAVFAGGADAEPDARMRALLRIAEAVTRSPQGVTGALVADARAAGADDVAIHDAVLVAATFGMFNRYVDGLATASPADPALYTERGRQRAEQGYRAAIGAIPGLKT